MRRRCRESQYAVVPTRWTDKIRNSDHRRGGIAVAARLQDESGSRPYNMRRGENARTGKCKTQRIYLRRFLMENPPGEQQKWRAFASHGAETWGARELHNSERAREKTRRRPLAKNSIASGIFDEPRPTLLSRQLARSRKRARTAKVLSNRVVPSGVCSTKCSALDYLFREGELSEPEQSAVFTEGYLRNKH